MAKRLWRVQAAALMVADLSVLVHTCSVVLPA